jgi:hypothetical protein
MPEGTAIQPQRIAKRREQFVQVPLAAVDTLTKADVSGKTYAIFLHLLHENWKSHGKPVRLANGFLDRIGVKRNAKTRALKKLTELRLVSVEWRTKKSPIVTVRK